MARGFDLKDAVAHAKNYINEALRTAPGLGHGAGALNHMAKISI